MESSHKTVNEWVWRKREKNEEHTRIQKSMKRYSPISHEEHITNMLKDEVKEGICDLNIEYTRITHENKPKQYENNRSMIIQTKINPYLKSNKYLDDINTQDTYLRPKNSNTET